MFRTIKFLVYLGLGLKFIIIIDMITAREKGDLL